MVTIDTSLKDFFDRKAAIYNQVAFIQDDPISVPHRFRLKQDIEIAGFFASIFAWGNRTTIIGKSLELMKRMDMVPYEFICRHQDSDLKKLLDFSHRTFNTTDLLYFIQFLKYHYLQNHSLETAFLKGMGSRDETVEAGLSGFYEYFFSLPEFPARTRKHIASPARHSACKRLNMFLRWMVRKDDQGVDFGIWNRISMAQLVCPIDVHVARVARRFGLLSRSVPDWTGALELTQHLKRMDPEDPVKYDYALFGLGVIEKF